MVLHGFCRNLKYIFIDGWVKRKLNCMDCRLIKKCAFLEGCTYFWNSPKRIFLQLYPSLKVSSYDTLFSEN